MKKKQEVLDQNSISIYNRGACMSRLRVSCSALTHNLIWIMPT